MPSSNVVTITTGVTAIAAVLGLWWSVETKLEDAIRRSTDLITKQIVRDVTQLAELHIADLEVRRRILSREIASYPNNTAPERLYILKDALASQISETKEKTW